MRMSRVLWFLLGVLVCAPLVAKDRAEFPGQRQDYFRLPNGWRIAPAGEQVLLKDLPLNIVPLADGAHALVATSGYNEHELTRIDLGSKVIEQTETVHQSWFGIALSPKQDKLWWSGGGSGVLHVIDLKDRRLVRADNGEPSVDSGHPSRRANSFRSGLAFDSRRNVIYSLDINLGQLIATDLSGGQREKTLLLGGRPYDVAIARNGSRLYVSDWARRVVLAVDPTDLRVISMIGVGEHPNQLAV